MLERWPVERRVNGHVTDVVNLMEGKLSSYRSGHFNGGRTVMLWRWPVYGRENGFVTEVASLKKENGHVTEVVTNGGRMVMLQKWSLMEGEWSCYSSGH